MTNKICNKTALKAQKTQIVPKMPKSNIKFQNVPENSTKKREIATLLTFSTRHHEFLQIFYTKQIFFTPTLLARWYVFTSLIFEAGSIQENIISLNCRKCITLYTQSECLVTNASQDLIPFRKLPQPLKTSGITLFNAFI